MSVLSSILQALFPSVCACCDEVLVDGERQICLHCLYDMEQTRLGSIPDNLAERRLAAIPNLDAVMAAYRFQHENTVQAVVHAMKYHACTELCLMMGRQMGLALLGSGRFDDVDLMIPVPLHWRRRLKRGYNQSELLCRGIAAVMPRPIDTRCLVRHRYTRQQSRQQGDLRRQNVEGAFSLRHPETLQGRHVLLVDDVLTTGATLAACCHALADVPDLRISVATFCIAL